MADTLERQRLAEAHDKAVPWRAWGPYLSERQWGTVREDYSPDGDAWDYFTHDQARSRAYRWGEDGLAGFSDDKQRLCFALALWNGNDPILKERLFGLTNSEGNHGEDVKEYYFYLDSTPTHSYMKYLYKYPQAAFPYADLVETNRARSRTEPEYELLDTGVFDGDRYFDVLVEYAKETPDEILVRVTVTNRGRRSRELARIADVVVSEHLVVGRRRGKARIARGCSARWNEHRPRRSPRVRRPLFFLRRQRAAALHRKRDQQRAPIREPQQCAVRQGWYQRIRRARLAWSNESCPVRHQGRRARLLSRWNRGNRTRSACVLGWKFRPRTRSASASTAWSPREQRRPTTSTPRCCTASERTRHA